MGDALPCLGKATGYAPPHPSGLEWHAAESAEAPRRLILAVRELHEQGLQRLRVVPSIAPSGLAWRCDLTHAGDVSNAPGARLCNWAAAFHYSSAQGYDYFGSGDLSALSPSELSVAIRDMCPGLTRDSTGDDPDYVAWFAEVVRATHPHHLPYAFADWETPTDHLLAAAFWGDLPEIRLPLPPPGGCDCSSPK